MVYIWRAGLVDLPQPGRSNSRPSITCIAALTRNRRSIQALFIWCGRCYRQLINQINAPYSSANSRLVGNTSRDQQRPLWTGKTADRGDEEDALVLAMVRGRQRKQRDRDKMNVSNFTFGVIALVKHCYLKQPGTLLSAQNNPCVYARHRTLTTLFVPKFGSNIHCTITRYRLNGIAPIQAIVSTYYRARECQTTRTTHIKLRPDNNTARYVMKVASETSIEKKKRTSGGTEVQERTTFNRI